VDRCDLPLDMQTVQTVSLGILDLTPWTYAGVSLRRFFHEAPCAFENSYSLLKFIRKNKSSSKSIVTPFDIARCLFKRDSRADLQDDRKPIINRALDVLHCILYSSRCLERSRQTQTRGEKTIVEHKWTCRCIARRDETQMAIAHVAKQQSYSNHQGEKT